MPRKTQGLEQSNDIIAKLNKMVEGGKRQVKG
jgi:hypothetical protein